MSKKIELLEKLKEIHEHYKNASNETQIRIFDASGFVVDKVCGFVLPKVGRAVLPLGVGGVDRAWLETYLCYGDEFLKFEYGVTMDEIIGAIDN